MKFPSKISIAGKSIDIIIDHNYCMLHKVYGACQYDKNIIIIDDFNINGLSKELRNQTLIHEIIHFCNSILDQHGECDDEKFVNPLSELLYQVFKQIN